MFFGRLCHVGHLILVMSATNAVSERSFSTLTRVKSYLQATMNQHHFMIARIYKESLDAMDLTSIADDFVSGNEHRLRIFGKF